MLLFSPSPCPGRKIDDVLEKMRLWLKLRMPPRPGTALLHGHNVFRRPLIAALLTKTVRIAHEPRRTSKLLLIRGADDRSKMMGSVGPGRMKSKQRLSIATDGADNDDDLTVTSTGTMQDQSTTNKRLGVIDDRWALFALHTLQFMHSNKIHRMQSIVMY